MLWVMNKRPNKTPIFELKRKERQISYNDSNKMHWNLICLLKWKVQ